MTVYDAQRLANELAALSARAPSTTTQGRKLEDLAAWLFDEVPGCEVPFRNTTDMQKTEEKDIWVLHVAATSGLALPDALFPIECKNESAKASSAEIKVFGDKIRASGGRDGVFIAREGLAGSPGVGAHLTIRDQLQQSTRVVVLTGSDLAVLTCTDDLVQLVNERLIELRVNQTYVSI